MATHRKATILALGLLLPFGTAPAPALTINLTYDIAGQAGSIPTGDSDGSELMRICQAAADYWEDIIEDSHTLNLQVRYDNSISGIGKWTESSESGGRPTGGAISFKGTTSWYYDPTPDNHDEYNLQQTLVRDLTTTALNQTYGGSPPPLLEFSFTGTTVAGAPAAALMATDLYSVALHEICHALGMSTQLSTCVTEVNDTDYDVDPALANGAVFDVVQNTTGGAHTICSQCLMTPGIPQQRRRLPSATDILALATCPSPGWSDLDLPRQDFLPGGTTNWNTAGNWVGNQVPGSLDDASVRIGKQAGVVSGVNITLSSNVNCRDFFLGESTDLETNGFRLDVGGTATLAYDGSGPKPQAFVESGGELETGDLLLNGGELDMVGGLADINGDVTLSPNTNGQAGEITGFGTVDVSGVLFNDGRITATDLVTNTLTFTSSASNPWDLDGPDGDGQVLATSGNLDFSSGALRDAFDGLMRVNDPFTLDINEPWILNVNGTIDLNGGSTDFAVLAGGLITAASGNWDCSLRCRVTAPVNFSGTVDLDIFGGAELEMTSPVTFDGGSCVLSSAALLELDDLAIINGGTFILNDDSTIRSDGAAGINGGQFTIGTNANLDLEGVHILTGGTFTGNGTLRFDGPTFINDPVTVDCDTLDLDGNGIGTKQVNLNDDLTVNSSSLDSSGAINTFNSTLNFGSGVGLNSVELSILGVPSWTMAGTMNVNSGTTFTLPSVSGVPFTMSGTTNVNDSTRWDAVATISGMVNIPAAGDTLGLNGGNAASTNRIEGGTINGPGKLRATSTANLVGHGTVSSPIDFLGSDSPGGSETRLLADDGTLFLNGPFVNVPEFIGTADTDGFLAVASPWTVTSNDTLLLLGGGVSGGTITNENLVTGHGTISSQQLVNNGTIAASGGQTLVLDTVSSPDLDGTGTPAEVALHNLYAVNGNLLVTGPPLDTFGGAILVNQSRTLTVQGGLTVDELGTITLLGGTSELTRAVIDGTTLHLVNALAVLGEGALLTDNTFATTCTVNLATPTSVLRLFGNSTVQPGATFSGTGQVVAAPTSSLGLADGADLAVSLVNEGIMIISGSPGQATLAAYTQTPSGRLALVLNGRPATNAYDVITVNGPVSLDGRLSILFNVPDAQVGDTWKIVDANSLTGSFLTFDVINLPVGLSLVRTEANDGVYLELVGGGGSTYLDWAIAEGIPAISRAVDDNPDLDLLENGIELFLGGDPNAPDHGLLPLPEVLHVEGSDYLSLTVVLPNTFIPTDIFLRVTRSTDGVGWSTTNVVLEDSSIDPGSGAETRIYRSAFPFASLPVEFLRIEAGP